jgi:hypothetical protein
MCAKFAALTKICAYLRRIHDCSQPAKKALGVSHLSHFDQILCFCEGYTIAPNPQKRPFFVGFVGFWHAPKKQNPKRLYPFWGVF